MNFDKYKNNGWGLSKIQFKLLYNIMSNDKIYRILEFGSGKSTEFFCDVSEDFSITEIVSFEDSIDHGFKIENISSKLNFKIRNLVECDDEAYNLFFINKKINPKLLFDKKTPLSSRQKNNFYKIQDKDLVGIYDLIVIDGPNGNGRNLSYFYIKEHCRIGTYVLIDDHTHYDFVEKFGIFFEYEELFNNISKTNDKWEDGGNFVIFKITNIK